jgi:hypothetical protein
VSSEAYKRFLRGIMFLYSGGPILSRLESAMNLAAEIPVAQYNDELLLRYTDNIQASGVTGEINGSAQSFTVDPSEFVFTEDYVGWYLEFTNSENASNLGVFEIRSVVGGVVYLSSEFGFTSEAGLEWNLYADTRQVITTEFNTFYVAHGVPVRKDIKDPMNFGVLRFKAFERFTDAFRVIDYLEDPHWWHNKVIPPQLWEASSRRRRIATTRLYENIVGGERHTRVGDPGFFVGADSEGNVFNTSPSVPIYRRTAAAFLFDKYLKMHMFYIKVARGMPISQQVIDDMLNFVLVAKPSYTYAYLDPGALLIDRVILEEHFNIPEISFTFTSPSDALNIAGNTLIVGSESAPWKVGDSFRYGKRGPLEVPDPNNPFDLPDIEEGDSVYQINFDAIHDGEPVLEGVDYRVNWARNPSHPWMVRPDTTWDPGTVNVTYLYVELTGPDEDRGIYEDGWTPLIVGGTNPAYVRKVALDPESETYEEEFASYHTEYVDRTVQLTVEET